MAERLYRAQILLRRAQHRALKLIADREDRSLSDVARQAIDLGLQAMEVDDQTRLARFTSAMQALEAGRLRILAEHGPVEQDLIAEGRRTRDRDLADRSGG